jgi:MFS family permease
VTTQPSHSGSEGTTDRSAGQLHAATGRRRWLQHREVWRALAVRDFRLLWMGQSLSILGDQFYFIALPWLTLQLTGSGLALGTVLMTAAIPRAILVLLGGALTDRVSPRLVLLGSDTVRAALIGLLAALVLVGFGRLWQLYILALLFGTVDALFYPAFDSIAPRILAADSLTSGNALLQGSVQASNLVGPLLAGLLIAAVGGLRGSGLAFALDAVSFGVSALTLALMTDRSQSPVSIGAETEARSVATTLIGEIKAGIGYAWQDPVIRALLGIILVASVTITSPLDIGLPTLAHSRFVGGAAAFGIMITVFGLGALLGTLVAGVVGQPRQRGVMVGLLTLAFSLGLAVIGFTTNLLVAAATLGILGIGNGFINVVVMTWLQQRVDAKLLGRVMSLVAFAQFGVSPMGLILAGVMVQYSVTLLFLAAGGLLLVTALATLANRTVRAFD